MGQSYHLLYKYIGENVVKVKLATPYFLNVLSNSDYKMS